VRYLLFSPAPPSFAPPPAPEDDEDAESEEQDQQDDSQEHARDDPYPLLQRVVHGQDQLVNLQLDARRRLVQDRAAVLIHLQGKKGQFGVGEV